MKWNISIMSQIYVNNATIALLSALNQELSAAHLQCQGSTLAVHFNYVKMLQKCCCQRCSKSFLQSCTTGSSAFAALAEGPMSCISNTLKCESNNLKHTKFIQFINIIQQENQSLLFLENQSTAVANCEIIYNPTMQMKHHNQNTLQ